MGLALVILALLAVPISATDYKVGDASGWDLGVNYKSWLAGKTFLVGDRLVFTYGSTHTVDEVNQSGYTSCSASNAISTASDGNTTIHLTAVGTRYFLCGVPGHCQGGMKIQVTMAASATGSPSGAPSIPTTPPQQSHGVSRISHSISSQALAASFIVTLALGFTC